MTSMGSSISGPANSALPGAAVRTCLLIPALAMLSSCDLITPEENKRNGFDIVVDMPHWVEASVRQAIEDAASRWSMVLAETEFTNIPILPGTECDEREVRVEEVDDVLILVGFPMELDLALVRSGICTVRSASLTPVVGYINFDRSEVAKLVEWGALTDVAFHSIAHVLGFGITWEELELVDETPEVHFTGSKARAAFAAAGGDSYAGVKIPVDRDGGHWQWKVFGSEIMTASVPGSRSWPLSAITLQAMADMGYRVDDSLADNYELSGPRQQADAHRGPVLDFGRDFAYGPVKVLHDDGRAIR